MKIWMLCMTEVFGSKTLTSSNKIYLGQLLPVLIDLAAMSPWSRDSE